MRKLWVIILMATVSLSAQNLFQNFDYVTVTGRVLTREGKPMVNCNVELRVVSQGGLTVDVLTSGSRDTTRMKKVGWARTDDKGRYTIQGIPAPGSYIIVVKGVKGFKNAQMPLRVDKTGEKTVHARDLVLDPFGVKVNRKVQKLLNQAAKAMKRGDLDKATSLLKEADQRQPGLSEVHVSIGNIALKRKNYDKALAEFSAAYKLGERNPQLCMTAAQLAFHGQKFEEAGRFLDTVLEQQPMNLQALYLAGVSHYNMKDFDGASGHFARYMKQKGTVGDDVNLLYAYGMSELGRGEDASAARLLQQAYDAGWKADVGFLKTLANLYIKQKQPDKAKAVLKDLLEKFPSFNGRKQAEKVYNSL